MKFTLSFYLGYGDVFDHSQLDHDELKEMVNNKLIASIKGKYYTNTAKLGEVLMETMLQEVSNFCKIDTQNNWAIQAHQQVSMFLKAVSKNSYIIKYDAPSKVYMFQILELALPKQTNQNALVQPVLS